MGEKLRRSLQRFWRKLGRGQGYAAAFPQTQIGEIVRARDFSLTELLATVRRDIALDLDLPAASLRVVGRLPKVRGNARHLSLALSNLLTAWIERKPRHPIPQFVMRAWSHGGTCTLTIAMACRQTRGEARPSRPALLLAKRAIQASGATLTLAPRRAGKTFAAITLPIARWPDPNSRE